MVMTNDAYLIDRTRNALEALSDCPWLPDLTGDLVRMGWRAKFQEARLTPSDYGTSRAMAKSILVPRNVVGRLSGSTAVEVLDESSAAYYADNGIAFYTASEIADTSILRLVEEALNIIGRVPTLRATVDALVRSVHLIRPDNDDYDVSFSEPHIPFSVFVSIPHQRTLTTTLRVAEAVVHEAMHLQLTLIESIVTLVGSTDGKYFSPWRREYRNANGVLHGLYVFCVIEEFLKVLQSLYLHELHMVAYIDGRRSEIHSQARELRSFQNCKELTEIGSTLTRRMMARLNT
jgi:HEXXH motif-containing protein